MASFHIPHAPSPPLGQRCHLFCTESQGVGKSGLGFLWAAAPGWQEAPSEAGAGPWLSQPEDERLPNEEVLEDEAGPSMAAHREQQRIRQSSDADSCSSGEAQVLRRARKKRRSAALSPFKMRHPQFFPRLGLKVQQ